MMRYARCLALGLLALLLCSTTACSESAAPPRVREAVWAGRFYPAEPDQLTETVDHFIQVGAEKAKVEGKPIALIAPHAGYAYSGRCAGCAYAAVKGASYARVVVLAVNHRGQPFRGGSILDVDEYRTPLGVVPLDRGACALLLKSKVFATHPSAHRYEHSLEVQLPFLQRALGPFKLVPIVVGEVDREGFAAMAAELAKVVDDNTLVVVSSDFTHFGMSYGYVPFRQDIRQNIEKLDKGAIDQILKRDAEGFGDYVRRTGATICGRYPIGVLLSLLPEGAKGQLVNYYTSGDATGDYAQSVSYSAIVFTSRGQWGRKPQEFPAPPPAETPGASPKASDTTPKAGISAAGQKKLLEIARATLEAVTAEKPIPEAEVADAELQSHHGVFVTLTRSGQLRGCIGNFRPETPLYRTVAVQARMSALEDRRFRPVQASEAKSIDIEISVLLPAAEIKDPLAWEFGKHGIIVRRGYRQATFLPQVAEHFKTKEEMLDACCEKAGLPARTWREPETTVLIYEAQVFGERSSR